MNPIEKIHTSFSTQLALWVACFVVITSCVVIGLLASFSEEGIRDESIDTTLQALENTALRIDNTLRRSEMTACLEGRQMRVNRSLIEHLINENGSLKQLRQSLPNAQLFVTRRDSSQLDTYITGSESGYRQLVHDGREMYIFSQSVGNRQYSLTAVCPAEDIYDKYEYMYGVLLNWGVAGVLVIIIVLFLIIVRHLRPIHQLADAAQSIADGHFDEPLPESPRHDSVGRLTNSFIRMQQSLANSISDIRRVNIELEQQNEELARAYQLKMETNRQKMVFIQDMYHEIRTPLNIISGFAQVLYASSHTLPAEEVNDITARMKASANDINQLTQKLYELSKPSQTT